MKKKRLLMILQADNIENDYRLLKECRSIQKNGIKADILYYHRYNKNAKKGIINKEISWERKQLLSRKYFGPGRIIFIKLIEQWIRSAIYVLNKRPEIVCVHADNSFGLLPILYLFKKLGFIDRVLWDQRELPVYFINKGKLALYILNICMQCCDAVSTANNERREILVELLDLNEKMCKKLFVISNYPDRAFSRLLVKELPEKVNCWLNKSDYLYLQSPTEPERYLYNTVEALMRTKYIKLIISGRFHEIDYQYLKKQFGGALDNKVLFIGLVDPYELPCFIDHAKISIILYDVSTVNRKFCAPNRLYQSLSRGGVVLVGNNPTMANLIQKSRAGVVISGDGKDVDSIYRGIKLALDQNNTIKHAAEKYRYDYVWETQEKIIMSFFRG